MEILNIAIAQEGSATELAKKLDVVPSTVGNWKSRGVPKAWQKVLALSYKKSAGEVKATSKSKKRKV